jgi:hypothetical protein
MKNHKIMAGIEEPRLVEFFEFFEIFGTSAIFWNFSCP